METWKRIQELDRESGPLFRRMDADADLVNQVAYHLPELETNRPAKDVVNINMNDARVFGDRAQAFMSEASMQTRAEGKGLQDRDTTILESFDSDIRYEIDRLLTTRGISSLYNFLVEQSCYRGILAARYVSWEDKGLFAPDLMPCDSRYLVYEYGRKDLDFGAFRTTRSRASIEEEYPLAGLEGSEAKGGIWEAWDKEKCQILLSKADGTFDSASGGQLLKEKPNIFGYVPLIIEGVGAGSMMQDEGSIEHRHESIFANNRLLYGHLNMLGSILQTLNYMTFNRVHMWESDAGTNALKSPKAGTRKTIPIDKGTKGLFPMQLDDVNNATRLFYALILGAIQRGSLPNIDYGNLTFPLSAVAISKLTATKDAIFSPRLNAIAWFYRRLHYMIRDQYVQGGYQAELGEEGLKTIYNKEDLNKKYRIAFKFHAVSPEQDIANMAAAQQGLAIGMSKHTVFTNIIKMENPNGEILKAMAERVEQIDPVVGLFRYGHALIDQGTEESFLEADLVGDRLELMMKQSFIPPSESAPQTGRGPSPQSMIPLMEGGGGRGSPQAEEDQGWAEAPEEMMRRGERREEVVRKNEAEG